MDISLTITTGRKERLLNLWNWEVELAKMQALNFPVEEVQAVERKVEFLRRVLGVDTGIFEAAE